ncbi:UDP-N-acetylmuramate dehydrogenase [bacterium]|nr:UDP-N-acetylmuramate dehydrogenase [bacterium]
MLEIQRNVSLAGQCRFEVGGPAGHFAMAGGADELVEALNFARDNKLKYFVFAGGSNIFFADAGFRGLVIRMVNGGCRVDKEEPAVSVGAGYDLPTLVRELANEGLGGIEFLGNIPGSIGGAVVGNAGCYGRDIAGVLISAEVLDVGARTVEEVKPSFFEFAYRHSKLKDEPNYIVTSARLKLVPRAMAEILSEVEGELDQRLGKHPHFASCAGSFFKNPEGRPAWQVITEAGLDEARVGEAMLSPKHANFLINAGGATSADILTLVKLIQRLVKERMGIELEPEVRYVGPAGIENI